MIAAGGWVESAWFAALFVFVVPLVILSAVAGVVLLMHRRDRRRSKLSAGHGPGGRSGGEPPSVREAPRSQSSAIAGDPQPDLPDVRGLR